MRILNLVTICSFILLAENLLAQTNNQNVNQNVNNNNNTFIFSNLPVIKEKEYVIKYRTKYVENPQPKRVARRLPAPVCLLGYLWVYPEDLGTYVKGPSDIINQINRQKKFGRNDWRVPTPNELRLMENYADKCGLGTKIYLATDHRNGVLRLVSSGKSVAEQEKELREQKRLQQIEEEKAKQEEARQKQEEARLKQDQAEKALAMLEAKKTEQMNLLSARKAIKCGEIVWQTQNKGANDFYDRGVLFSQPEIPEDWRLPTEQEFKDLLKTSKINSDHILSPEGLIVPYGTYAINRQDGTAGFIKIPEGFVGNGAALKLFRFVQKSLF